LTSETKDPGTNPDKIPKLTDLTLAVDSVTR